MLEHFFTCPYCWEQISMLLDSDMSGEIYVEDCQVCCNPIQIKFKIVEDKLVSFEAIALQ
ncbi:MAG TPA: CPXCG motif-containing cysteine-rich protein [Campylobacterales bacterium]|nr:CPXCG motif-containing cysteine-rich protein [Campylobacterales bacterium]HIP59434.1 CPXCG motif-containing cysteine-rich protein [Campylobacterales bacterium]